MRTEARLHPRSGSNRNRPLETIMADTPLRADSVRANTVARRDMLAAALLGSAALATPAAATPSPSPWQIAMARFEAAQAAEQAYDRDV